jgi:hypothetical protein
MRMLARLIVSAFVAAASFPSLAEAQSTATEVVGGTTISVGGGAQLLSLPDINFTFKTDNSGAVVRKQTNSDLDDYGGAFSGSVETPFGYWGGTPVAGVVSGFFANVQDTDRNSCTSTGSLECEVENIVDDAHALDSIGYGHFTTKTDRDVDYWGVGAEARFGKRPEPIPDAGGYLFRLAYVGIGTDVRDIDQDNTLGLRGDGPQVNYNENLDTTYWGGFLSVGGEYNLLGYLGVGSGWGLRSLVSLRAGIYDANTDYVGRYAAAGGPATILGLENDRFAFMGAASFETRKQFGPRTSLSLITDYEYYSFAPQMKYLDVDVGACGGTCPGKIKRTAISDDDAFEVRTSLRLNIALGVMPAPGYGEPLK